MTSPTNESDHLTFSTANANVHPSGSSSAQGLTPSSSKSDFRGALSSFVSKFGEGSIPNERTRLLAEEGNDRLPKRSWTLDLDAAESRVDDGAPRESGDGDSAKGPNEDLLQPQGDRPSDQLRRKRSTTLAVAKKIRQRSKYYIPVTEWLPNYNWSLFSGDCLAGVTVACLLIPQTMSYASGLAKLTPLAGLWSVAIPAMIYGVLGTCRQLSVGPEAALCLLIGQMIQDEVYGDPHSIPQHPELVSAAIALVTTFQIGLITSILGLLRLGFLDVVLSRALLRGFVTAIGVIIFVEQLIPMLGMTQILAHPDAREDPPTLPLSKFIFTLRHLSHVNKATAILGFTALAVLIVARFGKQKLLTRPGAWWLRFVPEILLVVVGTTVLTGTFRWDHLGVEVLGKISVGSGSPFGLPLDKLQLRYFNYTFPSAFVCAIMGVVDSMVAARENGAKYGYAVSANRDLVALGATNLSASFLSSSGCIPIFGSITRSRLNGQTGARTQMSSIVTSIVIILAIFFLLPFLEFLPKATLAAIVMLLAFTLLAEAPHEIIYFWKMRAWTDFFQMFGTFILTILFSIETGLVASVVFSLVLVVQKSTQTRIKIIGRLPNTDKWVPIDEDEAAQEEIPGVLVIRIRESLSFANTGQLKERLRRLELYGMHKSHPSDEPRRESAKAVILHMGDVEDVDASAIQILYELTKSYTERGVGVHFAHLRPTTLDKFRIVGITELIGPNHFHRDLREAMREIEVLGYGTSIISRYS
ncbi:sulfate transporter family-domain-containing protein [Naematelia encephala]|uniref:Sulfate transporter family-domain-containing protein n=1 Tax=Naematelia encephala TaxID=71784 RepID=A0A1Y2B4Q6_9TREE|nr:sulfate transporter family-domain-containing protein [Naematelia encephala]